MADTLTISLTGPLADEVRAKLGLGRLPGDIVIRGANSTFYFPIVTCLILSIAASLLFWLFRR
jgi:hypothetical protein